MREEIGEIVLIPIRRRPIQLPDLSSAALTEAVHQQLVPQHFNMSVLLETSVGDIVIDLLVEHAPRCCEK
jgi:hypothetical protein